MSNINNQKRNNKKNIYGDRLKVEVSTGEKSPVCTNTPTTMSYQSRTHSGKIRAEQPPTSPTLSNQAYKEAGTECILYQIAHLSIYHYYRMACTPKSDIAPILLTMATHMD